MVGVADTPVLGPRLVPKIVMISPAEIAPVLKLAAFVTLRIVGSGAVTVRLTLIVCEPAAAPLEVVPLIVIVPVYGVLEGVRLLRLVTETARFPGVEPLAGEICSQLPFEVAVADQFSVPEVAEIVTLCAEGALPPTE